MDKQLLTKQKVIIPTVFDNEYTYNLALLPTHILQIHYIQAHDIYRYLKLLSDTLHMLQKIISVIAFVFYAKYAKSFATVNLALSSFFFFSSSFLDGFRKVFK